MDIESIKEILSIIRNKNLTKNELKKELSQYHESDIADAVPLLDDEEKKLFFSNLTSNELADLFPFLESPEDYLEKMAPDKAADIIESMDADDAVDILEEVDEGKAQNILEEMEQSSQEDINLIKQYDDDEVGSKITTNYIEIKKSLTIKEAMKTLIEEAPDNDNIANIFVVDENGQYYGTIILKDLIVAREGESLSDITKTSYPTLYAKEKISEVLNQIKDIDLELIPVLSEDEKIIGVITSADIIESVGEEMGEDYVKFAGLTEEEDIDEPLFLSVKKRIPWLTLLLCFGVITSTVLTNFDYVIATIPALVIFQSMVLGTGGNAGTQSLAVTIRSLAEDKINKKNIWRLIGKEFLTGLMDGLLIGIVAFTISFVFLLITKNNVIDNGYTDLRNQLVTSAIVASSLAIAVPIASLAGSLIPLFFKKVKIDPAVASGPFISTLSDMCGVFIYYGLASILFHLVL